MSRGLRVVQIDDLEVNFPFEPYDIQKHLMSKVVECIKTVWDVIYRGVCIFINFENNFILS